MTKLIPFVLLLFIVSCTHSVHLVNISDFGDYEKITSGKVIKSTAEQFVILGFTTETQYVADAKSKLEAQCVNGTIQGITSRLSTSHGFFSWTNKLHMEGLCVK